MHEHRMSTAIWLENSMKLRARCTVHALWLFGALSNWSSSRLDSNQFLTHFLTHSVWAMRISWICIAQNWRRNIESILIEDEKQKIKRFESLDLCWWHSPDQRIHWNQFERKWGKMLRRGHAYTASNCRSFLFSSRNWFNIDFKFRTILDYCSAEYKRNETTPAHENANERLCALRSVSYSTSYTLRFRCDIESRTTKRK